MLSFGSARAAFLLYQNAKAVTGAADHLSRYLVPLLREWSATDAPLARQLELLGARADSVCPALEFLMAWCSDKGSSLQNILFHARDTLHRIERFLASLGGSSSSSGGASAAGGLVLGTRKARIGGGTGVSALSEAEKESIMKQIDGHLKELDWALSSLTLAISVINASSAAKPLLPAGATYLLNQHSAGAPAPAAEVPRYISPSCLLRASQRMQSMAGGSGDLVLVRGSFYTQTAAQRGRTFADTIRRAQDAPTSTSSHAEIDPPKWSVAMPPVAEIHTTANGALADSDLLLEEERQAAAQPLPIAVNSAGGRMLCSQEGGSPHARWIEGGAAVPDMRLENDADEWADVGPAAPSPPPARMLAPPAPLSLSPQLSPHPTPPSRASPDPDAAGLGQWRQLFSAAELKLVRNATRNCYELHVSDTSPSPGDHLSRPGSSTRKFDLSATLGFRSTSSVQLGLQEDAAAKRGLSAAIDAVFAFEERIANSLQARYAFMIHATSPLTDGLIEGGAGGAVGAAAVAAAAAMPSGDTVSPLDIAYLARLCTYENMHAESNRGNAPLHRHAAVNLGGSITPSLAHSRASDEELWLLLAGVHIVPPEPAEAAAAEAKTPRPPSATAATPSAAASVALDVAAASSPAASHHTRQHMHAAEAVHSTHTARGGRRG
jgi:hypothetical protein